MNVCRFTAFDDLKKTCSEEQIINVLKNAKRFSAFEPLWLLVRIQRLKEAGKIEFDVDTPYPWTNVKVKP